MNERDIEGNTRLHLAVVDRNLNEIIDLVDQGIDITLQNDYGKYAFQYALDMGFYDAIPYVSNITLLNTMDKFGRYPIYYVSKNANMLYTIINMGASLTEKDAHDKSGIWHIYNNMSIHDTEIIDSHYLILSNTDPSELDGIDPIIRRFAYIRSRIELPNN